MEEEHLDRVRKIVREEVGKFSDGLEDRLAVSMRKALDSTYTELVDRVEELEEEVARLLRHTGLS